MIAKKVNFADDNQELLKSILPGLPISVFMTSFGPNTYDCVNWHWHQAFQYCIVLNGSVDFYLTSRSCRVSAGSGIFINIQQAHFTKSTTAEPSSYLCIDIPPSFICSNEQSRIYQKFLAPVLQTSWPQMLLLSKHTTLDQKILSSLQTIREQLAINDDYMELDLYAEVIQIWKLTFQKLNRMNSISTIEINNDNNRLKSILQYMEQHYSEKITLDQIAETVMLSKSECCRFFKKATDQSIFSYLNTLRINKSMDLLRNTEMDIASIANTVGYCNQSYFTDCFKKIKQITPKKFRQLSIRNQTDILPSDIISIQ